ncbi:MAG: hypothetical protein P8Y70_19430 [Candidatus Lokiarchaeota archaeon]
MTFEKLGPLLSEERTHAVCEICNNYIYKRVYYDENSKGKKKTVFVCKNCLNNNKD